MKNHYSELKVYPSSWEKPIKANFKKVWEIRYKFYCAQYPDGFPIRFKGMGYAKTLEEKQQITRELIAAEISSLNKGFNPITKEFENDHNSVSEITPFLSALDVARAKIKVSAGMDIGIGDALALVKPVAIKYGINTKPISEIKKRDIKIILDEISETKSNDRTNKVRSSLIILFNYFIDLDIFEFNFIRSIKKLIHVPEKRKILRNEGKEQFEELKTLNYKLWRFCTMFYFSGSRLEEFIKIDLSRIDLPGNKFQIFEKKGKRYHWVWKPINFQARDLWDEIIKEASPEAPFLFGNDLKPSNVPTEREYVSRKWKRWAKDKLGIEADLYALKHTYLNDVTSVYGITAAKDLAGHTSEKTTRIYAVDFEDQVLEKQKAVNVSLLPKKKGYS